MPRSRPRTRPPSPPVPAAPESYYDIKSSIFNALIDAIDLTQLGQLDRDGARDEIRDIVNEIITLKDVVMSIAEQEELLEDICNDVLGYGPLEPLLARDDIADIMINGARICFIEVNGPDLRQCPAPERLPAHRQPDRPRVDEASPICDARLPDGHASTSSCRRCRSTARPSPSASSAATA